MIVGKLWIMERHGTSAQAGHNSWARVNSLSCHRNSGFGTVKYRILRASTVVWHVLTLFYCLLSRSSRSLLRGGFLDHLYSLFLTGTSPNHVHDAMSDLNEIFKTCLNSLIPGCRYNMPNSKKFDVCGLASHWTSATNS